MNTVKDDSQMEMEPNMLLTANSRFQKMTWCRGIKPPYLKAYGRSELNDYVDYVDLLGAISTEGLYSSFI